MNTYRLSRPRRKITLVAMTGIALVALSLMHQTGPADAVETAGGGSYVALGSPYRLAAATNWTNGSGAFGAGETRSYQVTGQGGVPATNVSAVVIELQARTTTATTSSYLTAWPTGTTRPVVSSMQYTSDNAPRSNMALVKVGTGGSISIYNYTGTTNLIINVQGYFTATALPGDPGGFVAITPTRIANTQGVATGANVPASKLAVGAHTDVQVSGVGPIGSSADGVFANIVIANATAAGSIVVGPGGAIAPAQADMASMWYGDDGPHDSGVTVKLNSSGSLRITNTSGSPIDYKIDVEGFYSSDPTEGASFTAVTPSNIYSTAGGTPLAGGGDLEIPVTGHGNIPASGVGAVAMTVTVRNWTSTGTVTAYNADEDYPGTATVGFTAAQDDGNGTSSTAIVMTSFDGQIMLHNTSANTVNVTVTSQGWFASRDDDTVSSPESSVTTDLGTLDTPEGIWQSEHSSFTESLIDAATSSGHYTSSELDYASRRFIVYGTGAGMPASVQSIANQAPADMAVVWQSVPYTSDQFDAAEAAISEHMMYVTAEPNASTTALNVTPVDDSADTALSSGARTAAASQLEARKAAASSASQIPVIYLPAEPESAIQPLSSGPMAPASGAGSSPNGNGVNGVSRYKDKAPFRAGTS